MEQAPAGATERLSATSFPVAPSGLFHWQTKPGAALRLPPATCFGPCRFGACRPGPTMYTAGKRTDSNPQSHVWGTARALPEDTYC